MLAKTTRPDDWVPNPEVWTEVPWPDPGVTAYRQKLEADALEVVHVLVWREANGWMASRCVVSGDSKAQKILTLKKDEDFWQTAWENLTRWKNNPGPLPPRSPDAPPLTSDEIP